jgi:hypothetical protein
VIAIAIAIVLIAYQSQSAWPFEVGEVGREKVPQYASAGSDVGKVAASCQVNYRRCSFFLNTE